MIIVYGAGPMFDLPDPSPFVLKTEVQLMMAKLPFKREFGTPRNAPKGKVPFIDDGGQRIGDSTFIRAHIERRYNIDLDKALTGEQRAQGWAIERMLEDHLYFVLVHQRWMDDANFEKGPLLFFNGAPPGTAETARESVRAMLLAHGIGRHSPGEITELGNRSLHALSVMLGSKRYIFGDRSSAIDATAFGMIAGLIAPFFCDKLRDTAMSYANLVAYADRLLRKFYPDGKNPAAQ